MKRKTSRNFFYGEFYWNDVNFARRADRDREKGDRVLDYDGMIALLIKREGGVLEQARPRSNPERLNSLNRRYGLIVKVS